MIREKLLKLLRVYEGEYPEESETVRRFETFAREYERCFERDCWAGHITGSAWLVNHAASHVLLTHHKKLDKWLQLGGHSDGESDPLVVALREAEEESGLEVTPVKIDVFDLDIHEIPAWKEHPAHFHFDVRFALQTRWSDDFRVSSESHALEWVGVSEIVRVTREPSMLRMADKWLRRSGPR